MATRLQYLNRMGISVWVPRETEASTHVASSEPDSMAEAFTDVDISFQCLDYDGIGLCYSCRSTDQARLSGIRQFCDDVSFAIQKKKVTPEIIDLNFLLTDTGTVDQTRESTSDPAQQKLQKLPGQVIVFGDMPAGFAPDLEEITVGSSYQVDDRQFLVAEDVQSHLGNVEQKKSALDCNQSGSFLYSPLTYSLTRRRGFTAQKMTSEHACCTTHGR